MNYEFKLNCGIPSKEEVDNRGGIYSTNKKCPKCNSEIKFFDGGGQGGVPHNYCINCKYEEY